MNNPITAERPSYQALIRQFRQGDESVFAHILAGLRPLIEQKIASLIADRNTREDIYQDTLVRILIGLRKQQYTENGKFTAWATRIARNTAIDYLRNAQNDPIQLAYMCNDHTPGTHYTLNTDEKAQQEKQLVHLELLIRQLPKNQRDIVQMHYYKDMTFREISAATNENINTLLGRMRYALQGIRKMSAQRDFKF